jgi:Acetyltransferase (GNAT) domain
MLTLERVPYDPAWWSTTLSSFADRTVYQTPEWFAFLAETQRAEVLIAALYEGNSLAGYFSGLIVRKLGMRFLGSPLPGWTTSYMGFNLKEGVSRAEALQALRKVAFRELGCVHMEIMDRRLAVHDSRDTGFEAQHYNGFEIDLEQSQDEIFSRFKGPCRTCIRKAVKSGVLVEKVSPTDELFAAEYYAQLQEVFGKQGIAPTYSIDRVRALIRHIGPTGNLLLLRVRNPEGTSIATGIYPAAFKHGFFWGAASWSAWQHLRPNELLLWNAMLELKSRKIRFFDMGGAGDYKAKYGGQQISVPWFRCSRYPLLPSLRNGVAAAMRIHQRLSWKYFGEHAGSRLQ